MFSVLFPGQGSQSVGMIKELYDNFNYVRELFDEADEILQNPISKIILEGPKEILDQTENTQPAIFLTSYSIFQVIKKETNFDIKQSKYFAGHSLGEYSAHACAETISFKKTIELLKIRGRAMQSAVPKGEGGMLAVLGIEIDKLNEIINLNSKNFVCYVANDNSPNQIVVSGYTKDLDIFSKELKEKSIKNIKLPVSAPFHCKLMRSAKNIMEKEIQKIEFKTPNNAIYSNVTASHSSDPGELKKLLIEQIEKPVRWREIIINMIKNDIKKFVEIGPGKVLSGLIKRIDRNKEIIQVNNIQDIKNLKQ